MSVAASAPGKVLICGGYLVVEAPNVGLSVGVSARFTSRVIDVATSAEGDAQEVKVTVLSPQFRAHFDFSVTLPEDESGAVVVETVGRPSPFLYYSILYSVACAKLDPSRPFLTRAVTVELLASNDFYSQRNYLEERGLPVTAENLRKVPPHNPLVGEVSKTGLGSSAAMTTSFVACLMRVFGVANDLERIHRVAQVAHSVAQGKIGSGFDVFTATYGTNIYRRFPASCAEMMMTSSEPPTRVSPALLGDCIRSDKVWVESTPFEGLPRGLHLILGDIHHGGSSTPGMVAKVMAWRKSVRGTPGNLWDQLGSANQAYVGLLQRLCQDAKDNSEHYHRVVSRLSAAPLADMVVSSRGNTAAATDDSESMSLWLEAFLAAQQCRALLAAVGQEAEVPIEPMELTPLLNATAALPGVFAVGCPGAGGYDAVFALVLGDDGCRRIEEFWQSFPDLHVCPLLVREDPRGLAFD